MSRSPYQLSALARLDLLQIWNYLADHASLEVADKVSADIESAIRVVAKSPSLGHKREDLTPRQTLFYLVHSYFVTFRPDKKPLHVIRILHSARDVARLLEE
jgi:plasmid stabilization system protein ParE